MRRTKLGHLMRAKLVMEKVNQVTCIVNILAGEKKTAYLTKIVCTCYFCLNSGPRLRVTTDRNQTYIAHFLFLLSNQMTQPWQVLHVSSHWESCNQNGKSTEQVEAQCQQWQMQCQGKSSFQSQMG